MQHRPAAGLVVALAIGVVAARGLQRWPLALPFAACVAAPFRFPVHIGSQDANLLVPLYAVIGVAWLALALDALGGRGPVRLPPRRLARPTRPAARLGERIAGLEHQRDRGRQGDGVLRAALRRAAGGARGAPSAAPASRRPVARAGGARARVRRRGRLPGAPPRRLVEPQADGLECVQLVLPRQFHLLRPVDLRALPGGHDHARVRGAPVRHRAPTAAGRDRGGARLDRDPHVVLPVGVVRALRGRRDGTRARVRPPPRVDAVAGARWPSASRSWPCPRCATPASTA